MLIGSRIGPFELTGELGSGAMGTVYKATYREAGKPDRQVALKIISLGLLGNESAMARFKRESAILEQLRHPNIVRLFGTGRTKQTPFIAMEFVDGRPLDTILADRGRLGWEDVVTWGKQLCDALQHAHERGIIHRDLKPSNLMITRDGVLKLTDFGIAKDTDVTALTGMNSTIGTAAYMSPEQCRGERTLTPKSDLYTLGIVFYELLTGRKPFVADTTVDMFMKHVNETPVRPSKLVPGLPVWLDNLVMFLMEKDRESRPLDAATVGKMLADIETKVGALQSLGAEVAHAKRKDRPVGGPLDASDVAAAKSIRSGTGKKKRKKKEAVSWYQKPWVKAAGLSAGLLAVIGAGVAMMTTGDESFGPGDGPDPMSAQVERIKTAAPELKVELAQQFLWTHAATPGPEVEAVRAIFRAEKVRETEAVMLRRHGSEIFNRTSEGYDKPAWELAMKAIDAEKDGDLGAAAKDWDAVKSATPPTDPAKLPDPNEVKKVILGWVADKRINDIRKEVPARLALVQKQIESERVFENPKPYQPALPESVAARAVRLEQFPDKPKARSAWLRLASETKKDPDRWTWFLLATQQAALIGVSKSDEDIRTVREKTLTEDIEKLEAEAKATAADDTAKARRRDVRNRCRDIISLYDDETSAGIKAAVARAQKLLDTVPK